MNNREATIRNYIDAYNSFDVDGMMKDMVDDVVFENISGGQVNMKLNGLQAFRQQAEQAKSYFSSRRQIITDVMHRGNETEIAIDYEATLAIDLSNGMKVGDELKLTGQSVFTFEGDKIIALKDIS